jgi:Family of unknown function (DUF695)/Regulator of ribonuclease activity B
MYGNRPGSIMVDMGMADRAPDRRMPFLVVTGPKAHKCNAKGIPDIDEFPMLEDILSTATNFLTGVTARQLVGTFTHKCERLNYYYVKDTMGVRTALTRMYTRDYKDYDYIITIRRDPEWETYRTFLYPDEDARNWMENNKIITAMIKHGDSLNTPRNINFSFYFNTDTARQAFATYAKEKGYTVKTTDALAMGNASSYLLVATKFDQVRNNTIDAMSAELKKQALIHRATYNLWEAPQK